MAWGLLFIAGLFEIGWAIGLKYTEGFSRLWPTVWTLASMAVSVWLLGVAVRTLPDRGREGRLSSRSPLPPNRTGGFPASGSPVSGFHSGTGGRPRRLQQA